MQTAPCQPREAISRTASRSSGDDCLKENSTEDNEGNEGVKETFVNFVSFCSKIPLRFLLLVSDDHFLPVLSLSSVGEEN
jgi:hypothetical protein